MQYIRSEKIWNTINFICKLKNGMKDQTIMEAIKMLSFPKEYQEYLLERIKWQIVLLQKSNKKFEFPEVAKFVCKREEPIYPTKNGLLKKMQMTYGKEW